MVKTTMFQVFKQDKWGLNAGKLYEGKSKIVINALKKQHKVNIIPIRELGDK